MSDPFNLQRFLDAQQPVFEQVCRELRSGHKTSHWMWFIFPQIQGLGHSAMSRKYAISSRAEAVAYLDHPVLGARLRECTELVNRVEGRNVHEIFGDPDDMKFHSCMSLFASVAVGDQVFKRALDKYFEAALDQATLSLLENSR
jgi:uncharacterized protein (DUF1810 family)